MTCRCSQRGAALLLSLFLSACSDDNPVEPDAGPDLSRLDQKVDQQRTDGPPPVTECPNPPLGPPASGTCSVKAGSAALLLRGTLLAPAGVLRNGHLLVEGGKVVCAGCDCSKQPSFSGATVLECAKGVISASLINPHDHLGWTTSRPLKVDIRYNHRHEWHEGKNGMPAIKYPRSNYSTAPLLWGEVRMLMSGVTAMLGEGGIKGLVRNLDANEDNDGLGKPGVTNSTFPLGDLDGQLLASGCGYPKIPQLATIQAANAWVPHVAEGVIVEARNEFLCLSGKQAGGVDATQQNAAFIHAVGLAAVDIADLAKGGTGVIWSPRSNISLYGFTAQVVEMDNLGARISIGTDWTISGSMNMLRELACADELNKKYYGGHFSDRKLFEMATVNGAVAAGVEDVMGQLKPGVFADLAVWNGAQRPDHAAVVRAAPADLVLVLKAGVPLYGDEALVKALAPSSGQGCEAIEVCQAKKSLCLQRETQKTVADLKSMMAALTVPIDPYPLFFCGAPEGEPTCVPSRPNEFTGAITATDSDGDGLANDKDSCPKVFNPPRKMDAGKQPDTDGDKVGDECDPCPLDANTTQCATTVLPNDLDGDGITDDKDNCPQHPNKGQEDGDKDGIGDLCDGCPAVANPGGSPCPTTIRELRDRALGKRPPNGTLVKLQGVIVTALQKVGPASYGFFVREGKNPFEAFFVATKAVVPADSTTTTPLKEGDRVDVEGKLDEYFSIDEINAPTKITVNGSGDISPVAVKTADLRPASGSAEGWESQLVQVSAVTVSAMVDAATSDAFWVADDAAACTGTTPPCTKVGDFILDGRVKNGAPAATVGGTFTSITGVVNAFQNDYSLEPRTAADLVP